MEATMDEQTQAPTMEDLFNQYASKGLTEEANRFRTVPKGTYTLQITKAEPAGTKPNADRGTPGGRPYVHVSATVLNAEGKRQAGVFFNASWVEGRNDKTGRLDGMSKLWGNLEKAFDVVGKSVGEVIASIQKYPCKAYIDVVYQDAAYNRYYIQNNTGVSPQDQEKDYLQQGFEPGNTVLNIMKAS